MASALTKIAASLTRVGGFLIVGGIIANEALYTVPAGNRAVIFDKFRGVREKVVGEGTHFMIPWVQKPFIYDIRTQPRSVPVNTGSKDLQKVNISLRILYRPKAEMLPNIFNTLGLDYGERVLPSITYEVLKTVVAQFDASELITQRELVSQKVSEMLTSRAENFGIVLDDIALTHLTFGEEFSHAVEMKQVAQQEAERARYLVEKAEQLKIAAITSAEGDSQAAKLLAQSFEKCGEGFLELKRIETAEEIAHILAKNRNITYLPNNQGMLLNLQAQ